MYTQTTRVPTLDPRPLRLAQLAKDGRVKVAVLIGGAFQDVARWPQITGCHLVVYVDVPAEMTITDPGKDVIRLTLAAGHTIGTLIKEGCPAALAEHLRHRPGVNLAVGLAQLRAIGKLAIAVLLADPTFSAFIRSALLDPLLTLTNGSLVEVELIAFTSGSGGTGGPVANVLLNALFNELKTRTQAIVHLRNVRVGSLTYVGLGDRVNVNYAATLAEDLHLILDVDRHEREVRSLGLVELPMVKGDKDARALYAILLAQALSCTGVRERLEMIAPNLATETEFGTISILEASYWHPLSHRRIAEGASRDYVPRLEALRDTPARPARLLGVRPTARFSASSTVRSVADMVAEVRTSQGVEPDDFLNRCLEPTECGAGGSVTVTLAGTEGFELDSDSLLAFLRRPPTGVAEWRDKLEIIRTIQVGLRQEIARREPELRKLANRLSAARAALQQAVDLKYPKRMLQWLRSFVAKAQSKLVKLQNAIVKGREAALQHLRLNAELELLTTANARLQDILTAEERRVNNVLDLLRPLLGATDPNSPRLVENIPLDEVLLELLNLAEQGGPSTDVIRRLGGSATRVTLAGLAAITGASEAEPSAIARCLLGGEPPARGPHWGGRIPTNRGMRILVLPPVEPAVLEAVRSHAPLLDGDTVILAGDTAQGGANVVLLEVHNPREITEVVPKMIGAALDDACAKPELYAAEGDTSMTRISERLHPLAAAA